MAHDIQYKEDLHPWLKAMTSELIRLAKKWNNSQTEYNRIQFLEMFNQLNIDEQAEAVQEGSDLSKILLGWSVAVRSEIAEERKAE